VEVIVLVSNPFLLFASQFLQHLLWWVPSFVVFSVGFVLFGVKSAALGEQLLVVEEHFEVVVEEDSKDGGRDHKLDRDIEDKDKSRDDDKESVKHTPHLNHCSLPQPSLFLLSF